MAISQVQLKHVYPGNSGAFASNVTAGNLIIVFVGWGTGTVAQDASVSDSLGTSYTRIDTARASANYTQQQLFYGFAPSTGANTVTVSNYTDVGFTAVEYSGIGSTGLVIDHLSTTGKANPQTVTITGYAGGMLFGSYHNESPPGQTITAYNDTQIQNDTSHFDSQFESLNLGSTTSYTFGYNISTTMDNQSFIGASFAQTTSTSTSSSTSTSTSTSSTSSSTSRSTSTSSTSSSSSTSISTSTSTSSTSSSTSTSSTSTSLSTSTSVSTSSTSSSTSISTSSTSSSTSQSTSSSTSTTVSYTTSTSSTSSSTSSTSSSTSTSSTSTSTTLPPDARTKPTIAQRPEAVRANIRKDSVSGAHSRQTVAEIRQFRLR